MADKWIYAFGAGNTEGSTDMRDLLGGKGANLAEMASLDIMVHTARATIPGSSPYYLILRNWEDKNGALMLLIF